MQIKLKLKSKKLNSKLDTIIQLLKQQQMTLDDLLSKVQQENSVISGAVTLLNELSGELKSALAGPTLDATKVQQISDMLDEGKTALANAILANTPTQAASTDTSVGTVSDTVTTPPAPSTTTDASTQETPAPSAPATDTPTTDTGTTSTDIVPVVTPSSDTTPTTGQ